MILADWTAKVMIAASVRAPTEEQTKKEADELVDLMKELGFTLEYGVVKP